MEEIPPITEEEIKQMKEDAGLMFEPLELPKPLEAYLHKELFNDHATTSRIALTLLTNSKADLIEKYKSLDEETDKSTGEPLSIRILHNLGNAIGFYERLLEDAKEARRRLMIAGANIFLEQEELNP